MGKHHKSPQGAFYSGRRVFIDDELQAYLDSLHWFDKTRNQLSADAIRQILKDNLERYFRGEVSQDFIIGLAFELESEAVGVEDNELIGMTCNIDTFGFTRVNDKKVNYSKEEIDAVFRKALDELSKE